MRFRSNDRKRFWINPFGLIEPTEQEAQGRFEIFPAVHGPLGGNMEIHEYIAEFVADWQLAGHSPTTAETYARYIRQLTEFTDLPVTLHDVKRWLATSTSS